MTVIAYKAGRMACDSMCCDPSTGLIASKDNKIFRTKAGALIGESGDADSRAFRKLLDCIKCGKDMPTTKEINETHCDGTFLIVFRTGEVWEVTIGEVDGSADKRWSSAFEVKGMYGMYAVGCGAPLAMAFMRTGKSAKEAVVATCELNVFCAPPVHDIALHQVKPGQKKTAARAKTAQ